MFSHPECSPRLLHRFEAEQQGSEKIAGDESDDES
jgi:hypothetical protein